MENIPEKTVNLIRKHLKEIAEQGDSRAFVELLGEDLFRNVLRNMINVAYEDVGYAYYVADALNAHFPEALLDNLPQISKTLREKILFERIGEIIYRVLNCQLYIQEVEDALDAL